MLDINFQYPISPARPKRSPEPVTDLNDDSMSSFNPKLESMRSIKSKDYFDPPAHSSLDVVKEEINTADSTTKAAEQIRDQLAKKVVNRDSLGYRTFDHLVPQWWKMTKAEIVDVLVKQICFMQREFVFR